MKALNKSSQLNRSIIHVRYYLCYIQFYLTPLFTINLANSTIKNKMQFKYILYSNIKTTIY